MTTLLLCIQFKQLLALHYVASAAPHLLSLCDAQGRNALHWAAYMNQIPITRYVLSLKPALVLPLPLLLP